MSSYFENGGEKALNVPGMGVSVHYELPLEERFTHGMNDWSQEPRLTVRELSMLRVMDAITDKPDWNKKVFNDDIVKKWRDEALTLPLISGRAWEWCLAELQDKAAFLEQHGFVLTLESGSRCAKADTLIDDGMQAELVRAVQPLLDKVEKDWHPGSGEKVLNLVHPSLFPLMYGRTYVMEFGQVDLQDCISSCGQGDLVAVDDDLVEAQYWGRSNAQLWSSRFQWLPCEVKFTCAQGKNVRIASYINNLHPAHHQDLYGAIEKMIGISIPLWNEVLIKDKQGRSPPRIQTFGGEMDPPDLPEWVSTLVRKPSQPGYQDSVQRVREYLEQSENLELEITDDDDENDEFESGEWEETGNLRGALEWKLRCIQKVVHPEPSVAYTYEDWKAGKTNASVMPSTGWSSSGHGKHTYYTIALEDEFRSCGLQIIVKLAGIELNPDKPDYEGGNWHLEGMLNEHIVATSIYYYDVSNTTESRIRFRQEAQLDDMGMNYAQDEHRPLCEIFGTDSLRDEPAVQELGSVTTPHGRLLCFPNTLQHKVEPFSLADKTRPGHRRFLVLWLVDPNYRIASTANVPPQQHQWWKPHGLNPVLEQSGLPPELQDMVREETAEWPIGLKQAKELRLELMQD